MKKICLVGNPNSGKTSLYNILTNSNEKIGNWDGVTVDVKEKKLAKKYNYDVIIVDLPGCYSLIGNSLDEKMTINYLKNEKVDLIINVIDIEKINENMKLLKQLNELEIPIILCLNKYDLNRNINLKEIEDELKFKCYKTIATNTKDWGIKLLINDLKNKEFIKEKYNIDEINLNKLVFKNKNNLEVDQKIDKYILNKWLKIPIFILIMSIIFNISQVYLGPIIADNLVLFLTMIQDKISGLINEATPFLHNLFIDGIIGGFIAVIGFLPLIMIMYFCLSLLEDSGYMARIILILDPILKKVGLSGNSIISFIMGTSCSIPGIMSTRVIKNDIQRKKTILLTSFMPCGAKLPVIALFSSVFFSNNIYTGPIIYFTGILVIILGSFVLNKIIKDDVIKENVINLEDLPHYKVPSIKYAFNTMICCAKKYIINATTIILLSNILIQTLQSFDFNFNYLNEGDIGNSILATIIKPLSFIFIPIGFGIWQLTVAAITGLIARENIVGTLSIVYGFTNIVNNEDFTLTINNPDIMNLFNINQIQALSYLLFILFTPPCFAAIGAMKAELSNKRWYIIGICFQLLFGYTIAFIVYNFLNLIIYNINTFNLIPLIILITLWFILVKKMKGLK